MGLPAPLDRLAPVLRVRWLPRVRACLGDPSGREDRLGRCHRVRSYQWDLGVRGVLVVPAGHRFLAVLFRRVGHQPRDRQQVQHYQ